MTRTEYWVQYRWPNQANFIGLYRGSCAQEAKEERKSAKLKKQFRGAEVRAVKITTTIIEEVL